MMFLVITNVVLPLFFSSDVFSWKVLVTVVFAPAINGIGMMVIRFLTAKIENMDPLRVYLMCFFPQTLFILFTRLLLYLLDSIDVLIPVALMQECTHLLIWRYYGTHEHYFYALSSGLDVADSLFDTEEFGIFVSCMVNSDMGLHLYSVIVLPFILLWYSPKTEFGIDVEGAWTPFNTDKMISFFFVQIIPLLVAIFLATILITRNQERELVFIHEETRNENAQSTFRLGVLISVTLSLLFGFSVLLVE
eukprot:TRINITY_DN7049_c0_g1_i4.p2 TRINITY_DN7049_c0_g1~~TRINITY_DN7049_c0_g1_i4.p2  ORF type:complete len:249 (-),score=57.06 TRINITY_DN7049_c0_g1_i4:78-824(-)